MIIKEILELAEDQGIGILGETLFEGELPLSVVNCVAGVQAPSPQPNNRIPYYIQTVDFWVRDSNPETALNKARSVRDLYHQKYNYNTTNYHIFISHLLGSIFDNGYDINRNKLYQVSISFLYKEEVI